MCALYKFTFVVTCGPASLSNISTSRGSQLVKNDPEMDDYHLSDDERYTPPANAELGGLRSSIRANRQSLTEA